MENIISFAWFDQLENPEICNQTVFDQPRRLFNRVYSTAVAVKINTRVQNFLSE